MAKKDKGTKAESKVKKKKWFTIVAAKLFNERSLGETLAYESSELVGRIIEQNMMTLAGDMKKQHLGVKFKVREVVGDKALTDIVGVEMYPSSVKRLIRRDKERIDDSFVVKTSDNKPVRVKTLIITRSKIARPVRSKLRKYAEKIIFEEFAVNSYDNIIEGIISLKLQRMLRDMLTKIFPVRTFEIRAFYVEKKKVKLKKKEMIDIELKENDSGDEISEEEGNAQDDQSSETTEDFGTDEESSEEESSQEEATSEETEEEKQ